MSRSSQILIFRVLAVLYFFLTANFRLTQHKKPKKNVYLKLCFLLQEIHRVQEAMSHAVYVHDISHIIIDNMQFMLGSANSMDRFQVQDQAIQLFRLVQVIKKL